jgi:hypothetical protein
MSRPFPRSGMRSRSSAADPRRWVGRFAAAALAFAAAGGWARTSRAREVAEPPPPPRAPDLGAIRYHDPQARRELWFGAEVGGVALPAAVTRGRGPVSVVGLTPSWALALSRRMAIGGRHGWSWLGTERARLRSHAQTLEFSFRPLGDRFMLRDRASLAVHLHGVGKIVAGGREFQLGGVRDTILDFGYGMEHRVAMRWALGWRAHLRQVWVLSDTQRQARASARVAFTPHAHHRFSAEAVAFFVDRDPRQGGVDLPRRSVHGQFGLEYTWLGARGLGVVVGARYDTAFSAGETPVFELRPETLRTPFVHAFAGLRARWR